MKMITGHILGLLHILAAVKPAIIVKWLMIVYDFMVVSINILTYIALFWQKL